MPQRSSWGRVFAVVTAAVAGPWSVAVAGPGAAPAALYAAAPAPRLATPVAVFGSDDRIAVPARYRTQQNGIGLLFNSRSKTICTAFCVGESTIATAGHCLFRTAGEPLPPVDAFAFTRTRGAGSGAVKIAGSGVFSAQQNVLSGSSRLSVRPPIDAAKDWALVRLERPVCAGHVLAVRSLAPDEVAKAATEHRLFQLSYHRDYADWRLAYSQPCGSSKTIPGASTAAVARDFAEPGQLILHTCDTGGASSGSPLLVDTPQGPVVVGINVGTYVQSEVVIEDGNVVRRSKAASVANTAVTMASFRGRLDAFLRAEVLPSGERMRALQTGLRDHRLYDGPLDGRYGPRLKEAIMAYETAAGLLPTGIASVDLLGRVLPAHATTRMPATARASRVRS